MLAVATWAVLILWPLMATKSPQRIRKHPVPVPAAVKANLLGLLGNFSKLARWHDLEYWMCAGTLLGTESSAQSGRTSPYFELCDEAFTE